MSELRATIVFPSGTGVEREAAALNELQTALKSAMGLNERLERSPGLAQTLGPLRVFVLHFEAPSSCASALRALGGWYMRYPDATVTLKAEAPAGGIQLQLKKFSTVAFAQASAKVLDLAQTAAPS